MSFHERKITNIPFSFTSKRSFVKSNKNDTADAEAIFEAASRPTMRFISVKSQFQQDLQALHRIRTRVVRSRVALVNEIHGLLLEFGIIVPKGSTRFRQEIASLSDLNLKNDLSEQFKFLLMNLKEELAQLDTRVQSLDKQVKDIANHHPVAKRLQTIPGIGSLRRQLF